MDVHKTSKNMFALIPIFDMTCPSCTVCCQNEVSCCWRWTVILPYGQCRLNYVRD